MGITIRDIPYSGPATIINAGRAHEVQIEMTVQQRFNEDSMQDGKEETPTPLDIISGRGRVTGWSGPRPEIRGDARLELRGNPGPLIRFFRGDEFEF